VYYEDYAKVFQNDLNKNETFLKVCVHICAIMQCCIRNWVIECLLNLSVLTKCGTRLVFAAAFVGFRLQWTAGLSGQCDWSVSFGLLACVHTRVIKYGLHYQL
jgi:hypothetical protein